MASTMASKKNNKRKFVAVGLGLVGIAGLSVASAAQFELNAGNEAAIGESTFEACVDSADVDLNYNAVNQTFDAVNVTNILDADAVASCNSMNIYVTVQDDAGAELFQGQSTVDGDAANFSITGGIPVGTDVGNVSVVIG